MEETFPEKLTWSNRSYCCLDPSHIRLIALFPIKSETRNTLGVFFLRRQKVTRDLSTWLCPKKFPRMETEYSIDADNTVVLSTIVLYTGHS